MSKTLTRFCVAFHSRVPMAIKNGKTKAFAMSVNVIASERSAVENLKACRTADESMRIYENLGKWRIKTKPSGGLRSSFDKV